MSNIRHFIFINVNDGLFMFNTLKKKVNFLRASDKLVGYDYGVCHQRIVAIKKRYIYRLISKDITRVDTLRLKDGFKRLQLDISDRYCENSFMFTFGSDTSIVICTRTNPKHYFILHPETCKLTQHESPLITNSEFLT